MSDIYDIQHFLKNLLDPDDLSDISLNGIQVENDVDIKKIGFAVDASLTSIKEAIKSSCALLIVHHGFFWGKPIAISGLFRNRIKLMLENNLGLIAYHLPLDAHKDFGNNIQILKKIVNDSFDVIPFGEYHGKNIGWEANLKKTISIDKIAANLGISLDDKGINYLGFGKKEIKTIACVSGGGKSCFDEAIDKKIDLFITGEPSHELFHTAKENNINILFAGHYFTETFGVMALQTPLRTKFNVETLFLNIPTGL